MHRSRDRPRNYSAISITNPALYQLGEEFCGVFQIGGVEALGEPAVDGRKKFARLGPPALLAPEAGEARRGAQFVAPRALLSGYRQGGAERVLGLRRIGIWQPTGELAAQAMNFCVIAPRAGDGRCCQCVIQGSKGFLYLSGSASASASRVRFNGMVKRAPVASAAAKPSRMRAIPIVASPLWASAQP
jgi:hypothetical protein